MRIVRPDYWVMRVSLLGMDKAQHKRLLTILGNVDDRFVRDNRSWLSTYAKDRYEADTHSEEMRYFNLAGGPKGGGWYHEARAWLEKYNFGKYGSLAEGPLLRATVQGRPKLLTHMPMQRGSTYAHVPTALVKAWKINVSEGVVDTELDIAGDKFTPGNHGNRRHADKKATDTMQVTGCDTGDLDDHFGWDQAERKKKSQLKYRGKTHRNKRARVTMML
jgi:hypothetical protein